MHRVGQMGLLSKAVPVAMLAFVVSSMLAVGLSLTVSQITAPLRNDKLVALALLANFVLTPLSARLKARHSQMWLDQVRSSVAETRSHLFTGKGALHWDLASLLAVMWNQWNTVFRRILGQAERTSSPNSAMYATSGRTRNRSRRTMHIAHSTPLGGS